MNLVKSFMAMMALFCTIQVSAMVVVHTPDFPPSKPTESPKPEQPKPEQPSAELRKA